MDNQKKKRIWFGVAIGISVTVAVILGIVSATVCGKKAKGEEVGSAHASVTEEKGFFRVLVAGTDRASGLSDVLMLVSLNRDTGEVWILQIPRDTYAAYTERSYRKLNGAPSALGGMAAMKQFTAEALGLSVDRYVRLSPDAFCRCVDALGGVEIELTRAMHYEDPAQGLSIHLEKGRQHLDGAAAEQFVRYRAGYVQGDLGRMDAQKIFLAALFEKVRSIRSPLTLIRLAYSLLGEMETDLTQDDCMALADEILLLRSDRIYLVTAPGSAVTAKSGASYYALSKAGMELLLVEHFGGREGAFDPQRVFLNPDNETFGAVYRSLISYQAFSARDLVNTEDGS